MVWVVGYVAVCVVFYGYVMLTAPVIEEPFA